MKAAVIYYSKTGNTKKVAEKTMELLRSKSKEVDKDVEPECIPIERSEELSYQKDVEGAKKEKRAEIEPVKNDLKDLDLLFLGTPVWCGKPATPLNTYMGECEGINGSKIICFVTHGGGGPGKTFEKMEKELGAKGGRILDTLSIASDELDDDDIWVEKIEKVVSRSIS